MPLPLQPYALLLKIGGLVVVAGGLFLWGRHSGVESQKGETESVQAKYGAYTSKMSALTKQVAEAAERARQEYHAKSKEAAKNYEDGRKSAEEHQNTVVADLRAGNLQLRNGWSACMSAPRKDQARPAVGGDDATPAVQAEAFGRVLRVGDDADNQVRWLQAELIATRKLAESCGVVQ